MTPAIVHVTCTHPADDARITAKELGTIVLEHGSAWLVALPARGVLDDRIHWLEAPSYRRFSRPREPWPGLDAAVRSTPSPRIVHCHEPTTVIAAARFGWTTRHRLVYDAHEYHAAMCAEGTRGPRHAAIRWLADRWDRRAARLAGHVITVNEDLAHRYRRLNPEVTLVRNAPLDLDDAGLGRTASARDPDALVYMGSVTAARGVDTMLEAFAIVRRARPATRLHVVGPLGDAAARRRLGRETPGVTYHGPRSAHDATAMLPRASIGLVPFEAVARYGVRPVKLLEYAIAGLSVVSSDGGEKAAWVRRHEAGAVVPPGDADALAAACLRRLDDPELARAEGRRGRAAARAETWERAEAPNLVALYRRLLGDAD